jgi:hypothetical protein
MLKETPPKFKIGDLVAYIVQDEVLKLMVIHVVAWRGEMGGEKAHFTYASGPLNSDPSWVHEKNLVSALEVKDQMESDMTSLLEMIHAKGD